jgi:nitroreductase
LTWTTLNHQIMLNPSRATCAFVSHVGVRAHAHRRAKGTLAGALDEIINFRSSYRAVDPARPIPDGDLREILRATQRAPSSFNLQPYKCVIVRDTRVKKQLAYAMMGGNTKRVLEAPMTAVFLADCEPLENASTIGRLEVQAGMPEPRVRAMLASAALMLGKQTGVVGHVAHAAKSVLSSVASHLTQMPPSDSVEAWSHKHVGLAAQQFMNACSAHGINTWPMEGFDPRRVRAAVGTPERYGVPLVVACGYPKEEDDGKQGEHRTARVSPRLPMEDVFCHDSFDHPILFRSEEHVDGDDDNSA